MNERVLQLTAVEKRFDSKAVFTNVSLIANKGQVVVVQGASGIGKTTLLEIAAGFLTPDRGTVECFTEKIAYAMQDDCLVPWLNVLENLDLIIDRCNEESDSGAVLLKLGLGSVLSAQVDKLSGGEKRRVNIARALMSRPDLLLLDEPFAFQDEARALDIAFLIEDLRKSGVSIVIAAHSEVPPPLRSAGRYYLFGSPATLSASRDDPS